MRNAKSDVTKDKLLWFPWYPGDYLSDDKVIVMNRSQRGSYTNLLFIAWNRPEVGTLPDDDGLLAAWAQCTPLEWETEKSVIMRPFELTGNLWRQKRMVSVGEEQRAFILAKSNAGVVGNKVRWNSHRTAIANASHSDNSAIANASQTIAIQKQIQIEEKIAQPDKPVKPARSVHVIDAEFMKKLEATGAYRGIDIDAELRKMHGWLLSHPGKKPTRQRFVNWLNRADPAISAPKFSKLREVSEREVKQVSDEQWEAARQRAAAMKAEIKSAI